MANRRIILTEDNLRTLLQVAANSGYGSTSECANAEYDHRSAEEIDAHLASEVDKCIEGLDFE